MSWLGKVVGGTFGFFMGGPLGAIFGASLGHQFDEGLEGLGTDEQLNPGDQHRVQMAFFTATFSVMGHIAKADGKVTTAEIDLAKHLIRYGEVIESVAVDYRPNYLTGYLFELAQKFSGFYTDCPVLKAEPDKRPTRLLLCDLTAKTIRHGLHELLGIKVVDEM